jgi:hypothetical protein
MDVTDLYKLTDDRFGQVVERLDTLSEKTDTLTVEVALLKKSEEGRAWHVRNLWITLLAGIGTLAAWVVNNIRTGGADK